MQKVKKLAKKAIYLLVTGLAMVLVLELGLRLAGQAPYNRPSAWTTRFFKSDTTKGWVQVPGKYKFAINKWGDTTNFVIKPDGERVTKPVQSPEQLEKILLIGGSFTMGYGLNDEQTFAWKLQEKFPDVDFRNLGVPAYGTYQSLLVLEEQLKQQKKPKAVIYDFVDHHRYRNIDTYDWQRTIGLARKQPTSDVGLPFVSLDENDKLVHGGPDVILLPFAEVSALSFRLQRTINKIRQRPRVQSKNKISELLLLEMRELCRKKDISFYVNILLCDQVHITELVPFLEQNNIPFIDCNVPLNEENTFRDDKHPKEPVQDEWTKRVSERLLKDGIVNENTDQYQ